MSPDIDIVYVNRSLTLSHAKFDFRSREKGTHLDPAGAQFFFGAQFSRKLARLYEYSYLGPVFYMNIHIAHDTKVFVTLREKKKSNEVSIPCP